MITASLLDIIRENALRANVDFYDLVDKLLLVRPHQIDIRYRFYFGIKHKIFGIKEGEILSLPVKLIKLVIFFDKWRRWQQGFQNVNMISKRSK